MSYGQDLLRYTDIGKRYKVPAALGLGVAFLIGSLLPVILMGYTLFWGQATFTLEEWQVLVGIVPLGIFVGYLNLRVSGEDVWIDENKILWTPRSGKSRQIIWKDLRSVEEGKYLLTDLALRDPCTTIYLSSMYPTEMKERIFKKYSEVLELPQLPAHFCDSFHGLAAFLTGITLRTIFGVLGIILCLYPVGLSEFYLVAGVVYFEYLAVSGIWNIFSEIRKIFVTENSVVLFSCFGAEEIPFSDFAFIRLGESKNWNPMFVMPVILVEKSEREHILGRRIGGIPYLYAFLLRLKTGNVPTSPLGG